MDTELPSRPLSKWARPKRWKLKTCPICGKGFSGIGRSKTCLECRPQYRRARDKARCETVPRNTGAMIILGLVQRLMPYRVWTMTDVAQYLHWLQSQKKRETLRLKLAGLIYENQKRYRDAKRLAQEQRGVA